MNLRHIAIAVLALLLGHPAVAIPLSTATRARVDTGQPVQVIVEYDATQVDAEANSERTRRRLVHDDVTTRILRAQGYARVKAPVDAAVAGPDATRLRDYTNLSMSTWRLSSRSALARLESHPGVRSVHDDVVLHANSVSDLTFINAPQAAAQGATGAGTVIAVIDGGLGNNYTQYADFGTCTGVNTPVGTCRLRYNVDYYPGASMEVTHGTNVSAIALGVASQARLAMYDVFNGTGASTSTVINAINDILTSVDPVGYNVVAVNLSLGDGTSHAAQCNSGNTHSPNYSAFNMPVAALTNAGIFTVVAAGNSGSKTGLSDPACVPGVVSVGAVYDGSYGTVSWGASGGVCTDSTAADHVTCFSQSAGYLTLLAPGSFVNAPDASFQQSGTSQATPHVSGALAALRARYPAEPMSQSLQRLTDTGVHDTDADNGLTRSRIDLLAANSEATVVSLSGNGPTQATAGGAGTYTITVTNSGPLIATNIHAVNTLPGNAAFVSVSTGCSYAAGVVTCNATSLGVGSSVTFTISVHWNSGGPVYDTTSVALDQYNGASAAQQLLAFGTPPAALQDAADAPLPLWSYLLLASALLVIQTNRRPGHLR